MTRKRIRKTDREAIANILRPEYNDKQEESIIKKSIKDFKDLDITDNFMFSAVMRDPELCKELLERVLDAFDKGHDEGLLALVRTLKPILVDFDKVLKFFQMCP